jgi:hypothetical protein
MMIFAHTHEWIFEPSPHTGDLKMQTRRLALPEADGGDTVPCEMISYPMGVKAVTRFDDVRGKWRTIYRVGNTYSVQPGRGMKAVGRIRLLDIRREDVRMISRADARSEGFEDQMEFLKVWVNIHDPSRKFEAWHGHYMMFTQWRGRGWEVADRQSVIDYLNDRPPERYDAWVLTFEAVQP